jgi:hypothetical protein
VLSPGVAVAGVAIPIAWVTLFIQQPLLFAISCAIDALFFLVVAVILLRAVILRHLATTQSLYGAVSAYLLMGLAWARPAERFSQVVAPGGAK